MAGRWAQGEGLRYPPHPHLGSRVSDAPSGNVLGLAGWAPPFLSGAAALLPNPIFFSLFSPRFPRSLEVPQGLRGKRRRSQVSLMDPCPPYRILAPRRLRPFAPSSLPGGRWVPGAGAASRARTGAGARPRACPRARLRSLPLARPQCPGPCGRASRPPLAAARGAFWPRILGAGEWEMGREQRQGGAPALGAAR